MTARELTYEAAIAEATCAAMERDSGVVVLGIGVADAKGVFGTTLSAFQKFGPTRVMEMPAAENAMTGIAIGLATSGKRPIVVHARNDFMFLAFDMLINLAAKWKFMFADEQGVPVVTRAIVGRGWGQGATHSQSLHSVLAHFPGLYVGLPACAADAKGLLESALTMSVPTVLLEHRTLYPMKGPVAEGPAPVPWGQARVVREGTDVTVIAFSLMVHEAARAAELLAGRGISAEVIDPRTLRPLDRESILRSVRKTGRLVIADTSWPHCGASAELAALAAEHAFAALKAPVVRVGLPDAPAPVSAALEASYHPGPDAIVAACLQTLGITEGGPTKTEPVTHGFRGPY